MASRLLLLLLCVLLDFSLATAATKRPFQVGRCNQRFGASDKTRVSCVFHLKTGEAAGPFHIPWGAEWGIWTQGENPSVTLFDRSNFRFYDGPYKSPPPAITGSVYVLTTDRELTRFVLEIRGGDRAKGVQVQDGFEYVDVERPTPTPQPTGLPGGWRIHNFTAPCREEVECAARLGKPCDGGQWPVWCEFMLKKGQSAGPFRGIPEGKIEFSGKQLYVRIRNVSDSWSGETVYDGPAGPDLPAGEVFWVSTLEPELTKVVYKVYPPASARQGGGPPSTPPSTVAATTSTAGMELLGTYLMTLILAGLVLAITRAEDDPPKGTAPRSLLYDVAALAFWIAVVGFAGCSTCGVATGILKAGPGGDFERFLYGSWVPLKYAGIPFVLIALTHPNGSLMVFARMYFALRLKSPAEEANRIQRQRRIRKLEGAIVASKVKERELMEQAGSVAMPRGAKELELIPEEVGRSEGLWGDALHGIREGSVARKVKATAERLAAVAGLYGEAAKVREQQKRLTMAAEDLKTVAVDLEIQKISKDIRLQEARGRVREMEERGQRPSPAAPGTSPSARAMEFLNRHRDGLPEGSARASLTRGVQRAQRIALNQLAKEELGDAYQDPEVKRILRVAGIPVDD
jgi:hypothetical protein